MKPSQSDYIDIRGIRYHVRSWGRAGAPKLFMLHGWMDVSASFQFLVDEMKGDWQVFAPDWRGYGLTGPTGADCYWFPDYFVDLDRLLDHFEPDRPATLIGHSMGGHIAGLYSGIRPERVGRFVNLEGFGMADTDPARAPERYRKWLDEMRAPEGFKDYANFDELAQRLQKNNPRLTAERAAFLAPHWGRKNAAGRVELLSDPAHKIVNPVLYRAEETFACWRNVSAQVFWVQAEKTKSLDFLKLDAQAIGERKKMFQHLRDVMIPDAGHMVHHDQPELLAREIENFLHGTQAS